MDGLTKGRGGGAGDEDEGRKVENGEATLRKSKTGIPSIKLVAQRDLLAQRHPEPSLLKAHLGRSKTVRKPESAPVRSGKVDMMELQQAQEKLKHIAEMGHIKVEQDYTIEPVELIHPREEAVAAVATPGYAAGEASVPGSGHTQTVMLAALQGQSPHTAAYSREGSAGHSMPVMYVMPAVQNPGPTPTTTLSGVVDVPVLTDLEGEYGFNVSIEDREKTTKSPMWLMSSVTKKLYTNINKAVPFEISLKKSILTEFFCIRAVPVFSSPQFLRTNVNRCPNHASPTDPTNHDFPYPEHVVRADHPGARYDNTSGRLSVVVPLDILQDGSGSDYTPILLRFMCLGSCVGGINRRPIAIILTLENRKGQVYGRKVVDVRVCACPTRDIRTDEQAAQNKGKRKWSSVMQDKMSGLAKKKPRLLQPKSEPKGEEAEEYQLKVCGKPLYDFMVRMKQAYYLSHPEYSLKYPDSSVRQNGTEQIDSLYPKMPDDGSQWDSDGDSPLQMAYEEDTQETHTDKSTSSSPSHLQSPPMVPSKLKFMVLEGDKNGTAELGTLAVQKSQAGEVHSRQVTPITIMTSLASPNSQIISKSEAFSHVPVVQVSQYSQCGTLVRARVPTAYKVSGPPPIAIYQGVQTSHPRLMKEEPIIKMLPLDREVKSDTSPESRELLAANVLVDFSEGGLT